jgi:hypothetical protein
MRVVDEIFLNNLIKSTKTIQLIFVLFTKCNYIRKQIRMKGPGYKLPARYEKQVERASCRLIYVMKNNESQLYFQVFLVTNVGV